MTISKKVTYFTRLLLPAIILLSGSLSAKSKLEPGALEKLIAQRVAMYISSLHYRRNALNDEISKELYQEYFDTLDHNRYYFLASDIQDFESYQEILDDYLLKKGNVQFAFDVYERYLKRVRNRIEYVRIVLNSDAPFDFTQDEFIDLGDKEIEWRIDEEELNEAWRKRLKNEYLTYLMMNESITDKKDTAAPHESEIHIEDKKYSPQEKIDELSKDTETVKTEPSSVTAIKLKSPKERMLAYYERFLKQVEEKEPIEILEIYLSSLTRLYGPHSVYMGPDTEEDFDIQMKLSLEGIGAVLTTEDGLVKVNDVIPGGPADRDGRLQPGDKIMAVGQEGEEPLDIINMQLRKVVQKIRGPKGSRVYLTVQKADKGPGSVPVIIDIVRDEVKLKGQEAKGELLKINNEGDITQLENPENLLNVLYLYLPSFYMDFDAYNAGKRDYKSSTRDLKNLIEKHRSENISGLILDLRSNGGGSLEEAISVSGLFFPRGPVVQTRYYNGKVDVRQDYDGETFFKGPMIVLVDHFSASASEIVAAALQDIGRAVVVGDSQTHGKGTVQTIYDLKRPFRFSSILKNEEPGVLKYTMAKFYRITGGSTQVKGVAPDITMPSFKDHMELSEKDLPHVLPWDHIPAVKQKILPGIKVNSFIPELNQRSLARRSADTNYQKFTESIDHYAERRLNTKRSLNKETRQAELKAEEDFSEHISNYGRRRIIESDWSEEKIENAQKIHDPVFDEGLHILADLIHLQKNEQLPAVPAMTAKADPPEENNKTEN